MSLQENILSTERTESLNEDRFRFLFENSIDAILLSSPEGKIEAANPAACDMFGRTEADICRLGREALVDSRDPRLPAYLEERTRVGRVRSEINLKRQDGSTFPGEVSSAFYQDLSGVTKAAVIIRDISERRRSEDALRAVTEGTAAATGADFFQKWYATSPAL
jgi:PAS domain S-box-containing protein